MKLKKRAAETSSEGSETDSEEGESSSEYSSDDGPAPNFEDLDAKKKYDRVQKLKDPSNTLAGSTNSSFFKYKEKGGPETMIQIMLDKEKNRGKKK